MVGEPRSASAPGTAWFAALLALLASGLVLSLSWLLAWPAEVLVIAAVVFPLGLIAFGVLAFKDERATGKGYWTSLWSGVRTSVRTLAELFP